MSRKTYTYTPYEESQEVLDAGTKKTKAETAYNTHFQNGFTYSQNAEFSDIMTKILNPDKFSYDVIQRGRAYSAL